MQTDDPLAIARLPVDMPVVVRAGPGSGKTWLLIERIKYLASQKLRPHSTIACITYTNAAADEIAGRLPVNVKLGFLGTIHSFLLNYIIYPYGHLVNLEPDFDLVTQGYAHEHLGYMAGKGLISWSKAHVPDIVKAFESIGYDLKGNPVDFLHKGLKEAEMHAFMDRCKSKGQVTQADLLWLSYKLLNQDEYAYVADALSCRFAAILVDEFQDTTELQHGVLAKLHSLGRTSLFLVGDPDQSIFSFAGASTKTFEECTEKFCTYELGANWRSTKNIVNLLNEFRTASVPLEPVSEHKDKAIPIFLLVGKAPIQKRIDRFKELLVEHDIHDFFLLARGRELVECMNCAETTDEENGNEVFSALKDRGDLHSIFSSLMQACKYKKQGNKASAFKCLEQCLSRLILKRNAGFGDPGIIQMSRDEWRLFIVRVLSDLEVSAQDGLCEWLEIFKAQVADHLATVSGKKQGNKLGLLDSIRDQLERKTSSVQSVVDAVPLPDEDGSNVRTIHGAKGLEKGAVLVVAKQGQLTRWIRRESRENEDSRIGYVAFSRAKELLCIATDSLRPEDRRWLELRSYVRILHLADSKGNPVLSL